MKLPAFESEFPLSAVPTPTGDPMPNAMLDHAASQADQWILVERAQKIAVLEAVHGFYLAKRFSTAVADFAGWTNKVAESAVAEVERRLWRLAVIDVAKVNDQTQLARAASLPGVLQSMKEALESSSDPAAVVDLAKVNALRARVNADTQPSLRYIRYLRNKWAAHPSIDRDFDSWADADQHISIPLVEEGLALLVRVHQDASDLAAQSAVLSPMFTDPQPNQQIVRTPHGNVTSVPSVVAWRNVSVLAEVMRESAGRYASALHDQLASPPRCGSLDDRD